MRGQIPVNQETFGGKGKSVIVHRGTETTVPQIIAGFIPNFRNGKSLRIEFANFGVPVLPELVGDFIGNVQPPAVDAVAGITIAVGIHPPQRRLEHVSFGFGMQIGAVIVVGELGQRVDTPPAGIFEFVFRRLRVIECFRPCTNRGKAIFAGFWRCPQTPKNRDRCD